MKSTEVICAALDAVDVDYRTEEIAIADAIERLRKLENAVRLGVAVRDTSRDLWRQAWPLNERFLTAAAKAEAVFDAAAREVLGDAS